MHDTAHDSQATHAKGKLGLWRRMWLQERGTLLCLPGELRALLRPDSHQECNAALTEDRRQHLISIRLCICWDIGFGRPASASLRTRAAEQTTRAYKHASLQLIDANATLPFATMSGGSVENFAAQASRLVLEVS